MSERIPLGEREDPRLEFKAKEALAKPETIGREVVAMLNAEGGTVWVGLGEKEGVAVEIQPVESPEKAAEALLDSLVDRLEPGLSQDEVRVEVVAEAAEIQVLRVVVEKGRRGPYALLKSGGRHFLTRIGNRVRPMTREEIFERPGNAEGGASRLEAARKRLLAARDEAQQSARDSMWLRIEPVEDLAIDVQSPLFEQLLNDPGLSGNRRGGWHFAQASGPPRLAKDRRCWEAGDVLSAKIWRRGSFEFRLSLQGLHWQGENQEIWPLALLESSISAFRLASVVYRVQGASSQDAALADLAFWGLHGWRLRCGSLIGMHWRRNKVREYQGPPEDLTWPDPLTFQLERLFSEPDRCGFRLVRRVYEAFGYRENEIPREFDRDSGRLVLPE